jgi:hypothetical protein
MYGTSYEVYDTRLGVLCRCMGSLWGALSLCRHLNTKGKCPGRYAVRKG